MANFARILETSPFLSLCRTLRQSAEADFRGGDIRELTGAEIQTLEKQGNIAEDWRRIRVREGFSPQRVHGNLFLGRCILGAFTEKRLSAAGEKLPSGIYFSTLRDIAAGDNVCIHRCPLVSNCVIDEDAVITASRLKGGEAAEAGFGNGIQIRAGMEAGKRRVPVFYDLDPALAEAAARGNLDPRELEGFLAAYREAASLPFGYIGKRCAVHRSDVRASFIGENVILDGACRVSRSTLFASEKADIYAGAGCILDETIARPGCRFDTQAVCSRAFFADASGAERQAKVAESYIGANTHIAEGEVTSVFAGPFISFHHQSLLIAAFWPGGRGNIGHGANVGSNHSSRAPDGEVWPGEGMFFGLGCNIKYPADYSRAPYSIIATGVETLPQKVEYPFSLITRQENFSPAIPSGYNRIIPAWVLKDNFYALRRGAEKFGWRNKADILLETDFLHAENIAFIKDAREKLIQPAQKKEVYLPGDIPGMGKNILFEKDRAQAVETYEWFLRFARLRDVCSPDSAGGRAEAASPEEAAEYLACLDTLYGMTLSSRAKDTARGEKIIPDYAKTHVPAEQDDVVTSMKKFIAEEKSRLAGFSPKGRA